MAERFTYEKLLRSDILSVAQFSFKVVPLALRTPEYDVRLLSGGANKHQPNSAESHQKTERWINAQTLLQRMLSEEVGTQIVISEAALRNFGGGSTETVDRHIQAEAISHVAHCALSGVELRVAPFDVDTRGAAADDFMIINSRNSDQQVVTHNLFDTSIYDASEHPQGVSQIRKNFEEIWEGSLPKGPSVVRLHQLAAELTVPQ